MPLFSAAGLGKQHGTKLLFREADFVLAEGARVGLVGPNGHGKTSLLKILLGLDDEFDGQLVRAKNLRIASLDQDPAFPEGSTVRSAVLDAAPGLAALEKQIHDLSHRLEHDTDPALLDRLGELQHDFEVQGGYDLDRRADQALEAVGFPRERHEEPVTTLSGGERTRVALARLLLTDPDLWLLDEPTNHLDLAGILFLERTLEESRAAAVIVSHDRALLDDVTNQTWEVEGGKFRSWPAAYTRARELRAEKERSEQRAWETQRDALAKTEEFIRRFKAGQRARQAAGRQKLLDRVVRLDRPEEQARLAGLDLPVAAKPGLKVLNLRGVGVRYGDRELFSNLDLILERGETLGIVGPNGAGKTSLLRLLTGAQAASSGEVLWDERAKAGTLDQHERFDGEGLTPFTFLRGVDPQRSDQQLRNTLGAMLFRGDEADKPVDVLSGGERKRLMLTRLLLRSHNVLLLDEPTNHLDLPSREVLELALASWEGTLVVVSHDRYFLDKLCDRILWIEDGRWRLTTGGFKEALAAREREAAERRAAAAAAAAPAPPPPAIRPAAPAPSKPKSKLAKLAVEDLEARIVACENRIAKLNAQFADPGIYKDPGKLGDVKDELAERTKELQELEAEYASR